MNMKRSIALVVLTLAFGAALLLTQTAGSHGQYQLGGGWIGNNGAGNTWTALQIPIDPNGKAAALRVNLTAYGASFAGLLNAFGANSVSELVGQSEMIGRDTAKYRTVGCANQQGNPPQRRAILVNTGIVQFTGPDNYTVHWELDVYPAATDADLDGFPDAGSVPAVSISGQDHATRVPLP